MEAVIRKIERALSDLGKQISMVHGDSVKRDQELVRSLRQVMLEQARTNQVGMIEQRKEFLKNLHETGSNYTNLIILAGYAGLFALWQLMNSRLSAVSSFAVAMLTSTSLFLFVGFEVFKMIQNSIFMRRLDRLISANFSPDKHLEAWALALNENARLVVRVWIWFLVPTVVTGLGAGSWLLYTFARSLIEML